MFEENTQLAGIMAQMRKFCDFRDRCHSEVRSKLLKLKVYGDDLEQVMTALIREDLLNEERFARNFTRGKFRINHWGRIRIRLELKRKQVSDYCIRKGLEEIEQHEYEAYLDKIIAQRLTDGSDWSLRKKTHDYLARKGFESSLILERIDKFAATL